MAASMAKECLFKRLGLRVSLSIAGADAPDDPAVELMLELQSESPEGVRAGHGLVRCRLYPRQAGLQVRGLCVFCDSKQVRCQKHD